MNSTTTKLEFIPIKSIRPKLRYLRFVLPLLVTMLLSACGDRVLYTGTCEQQTRQFVDNILSLLHDELNPVIDAGLKSGPATADAIDQLEDLDARVSELNTPACNPKTQAVKDSLRSYMLEVRNYFNVIAGRAVYGEGSVQAQLAIVYEANLDFETALDEVRR